MPEPVKKLIDEILQQVALGNHDGAELIAQALRVVVDAYVTFPNA